MLIICCSLHIGLHAELSLVVENVLTMTQPYAERKLQEIAMNFFVKPASYIFLFLIGLWAK
jgi:hypothetical protein